MRHQILSGWHSALDLVQLASDQIGREAFRWYMCSMTIPFALCGDRPKSRPSVLNNRTQLARTAKLVCSPQLRILGGIMPQKEVSASVDISLPLELVQAMI